MSTKKMTYAEAIRDALRLEMRLDPKVFIAGEDVGRFGGCFGVTMGLWDEFGDARVCDTPISESAIMGLALGAATMGLRPVAELMFSDFTTVCMDYLTNQAPKLRYMCGGQVQKLPLVVRTTTGAGLRAAGQHSQSLEGWFTQVPGLTVVSPATPADAKGLLTAAMRDNNPVLFLEHKMLYGVEGQVPEGEYVVPLRKADVKREGKDVTVITSSLMVSKALLAAQQVAADGISTEVIDLRTLSPLDTDTIAGSIKKTHRAVVVQEAPRMAGTNAQVIAAIMDHAFSWLEGPVKQVGMANTVIPFSPPLEDLVLPNEHTIASAICDALKA